MKRLLSISLMLGALAMQAQAASVFTGREAAQAVGQALIREGAGDEVRVQMSGIREDDLLVPSAQAVVTAQVDSLHWDKARRSWDATLLLTSGGQNLAPIKLSGRYDEMVRVPTLKQRMQTGEIIAEEDIVWEDVPASHQRKNIVADSKVLIGKAPKRTISAGRPIRLDEITGPTIIAKGSQVTLVYKTSSIEIKTLGEALENGSLGAVIKVKNLSSKAAIQGVVEGEGKVRISSPENLSAGLDK